MTHTTAPSPVDMARSFPQVLPFARTAVRLHPRAGNPTVRDSSVGGPLLWPGDEVWPICADPGKYDHDWPDPPKPTRVPLVPVLQLFARDVPELPFPDGADVLQVLWCPFDHDPSSSPRPELRWRRSADVVAPFAAQPPRHPQSPDDTVPDPCVIDPERVIEYPGWDLPQDVSAQIDDERTRLEAETGWRYTYDLSVAPGIKVGGYPGWTQLPDWPDCACGKRMAHLLTVASWEFSRPDDRRWVPLEDRLTLAGPGTSAGVIQSVQAPAGLMLGDAGGIYLFTCLTCADQPYDYRFDNS